ncbi:MAG: TonB-dependent receptor [Tannerella sp.]|nr:TonB-dependent receptor [Tannerella sp.]
MNKLLVMLIVTVFGVAVMEAQVGAGDAYSISGQVVDSLSNKPVEYATVGVSLSKSPTQYIQVAASDENGKFDMKINAPGEYILTIQSIEIKTLQKPFSISDANKKVDLGLIPVSVNTQQMDVVTVTAQRPLVKIEVDKLVYNMEEDPEAKVSNTLDMLRKVPLLSVDGEDNVLLKGSANYKIYLNGKPSNMLSGRNVSDVLKSMPANSIKNIEVITDPGARYDAEGVDGIINIITARDVFQGYQGTVGANAGTYGGYGANAYLTAKTGILGVTGNFNYNHMSRPWETLESTNKNFINDNYYDEQTNGRNNDKGRYMFGNLELSLEFDTLNLLSVGVNMWGGKWKSKSENAVEMFNRNYDLSYSYKTDGESTNDFGTTGFNVDYQRSTRKKGEMITFSYRYNTMPDGTESFSYARDINGEMPLYIRTNQWDKNDAKTDEHTGQIDYTNPLTEKHTIEAGIKYILRQNFSEVQRYDLGEAGNWVELPARLDNDFEHVSNIYAGYLGYAFKAGKIGFRTGLRAEGTQQSVKFALDETSNFDVDYFNLVPSVSATYQLKETQQLRLGYNLRIFRPSIWYLNPYVNDIDPYNISYGNPNLVPEKSNSFNLNYSYFSQKYTVNISGTYSYVDNAIQNYTFIDPANPDVKQRTYDNIGYRQNAGLFLTLGWTPNQKLRFNLNGGLNYTDMKSEQLNMSNNGFYGNGNLSAQLTLPKDFRINANAFYMSGFIMLQGNQSNYFFNSLSASKDLFNKKLTVSLACSNPFSEMLRMKVNTYGENFERFQEYSMPMRELRLSLSYRFGSLKDAIKKVQRGITNDDVMSGGQGGGGAAGGAGGGGN